MKKIRNFHAGGICGASVEGSGRVKLVIRNALRRNARHGGRCLCSRCGHTNAEAGCGVKGATALIAANPADRTVRKGPTRSAPSHHPKWKAARCQSAPHDQAVPCPLTPYAGPSLPARRSSRLPRPMRGHPKCVVPQRGSRQSGSSRFPRAAPLSAGNTAAVAEGDTSKPAIDVCDHGRERDDARAPNRTRDPDVRAARATGSRAAARGNVHVAGWKGGAPARRAHGFHRVCAYAPRAPRDTIKCAGLRNDASTYRFAAQRPSRLPARGRQRGRLRYPAPADVRRSAHACVVATPAARPGASRRPCGRATQAAQRLMQADQHERLVGTSQ